MSADGAESPAGTVEPNLLRVQAVIRDPICDGDLLNRDSETAVSSSAVIWVITKRFFPRAQTTAVKGTSETKERNPTAVFPYLD